VKDGTPSATAQRVARYRAEHQVWDVPPVFTDPLALPIIGEDAAAAARPAQDAPEMRALRAFVAVRSRFAEDALAAAVARGVRQYVILGAGLDTFAYRNPHRDLRVFEVDHPATQAWKRQRIGEAALAVPPALTFVPIDFASQALFTELGRHGFDGASQAFFSWLGVTMYLEPDVVLETLRAIAMASLGNAVAFDYRIASPEHSGAAVRLAARVALAGEPFRSTFEPHALAAELRRCGYEQIEDLAADAINARYFVGRSDGLQVRGSAHLASAAGASAVDRP
jgi:methyltransferase (TIGR00027 family)